MIDKFKTMIFVKSSLIFLYLSLTFPIPFISKNNLKLFSIITFFFGLFLIIDLTSDYVQTCDTKISYKTSFISKIFGKKNWEIFWDDIKLIKSFPTSQGSKVYYFITNKNQNYLVPQRLDHFDHFLLLVAKRTGLEVDNLTYISPLWTYKLLTFISILMIIGELIFLLSRYYQY